MSEEKDREKEELRRAMEQGMLDPPIGPNERMRMMSRLKLLEKGR